MNANELQKVLHREIPSTRLLGIEVAAAREDAIVLRAPLDINRNHKATAFGGSLYTVCVLCGWSVLYTLLEDRNIKAQIVIQQSRIEYLKPVSGDIECRCGLPAGPSFERLLATYAKRGMGRITLDAHVLEGGENAVVFHGDYVVLRPPAA